LNKEKFDEGLSGVEDLKRIEKKMVSAVGIPVELLRFDCGICGREVEAKYADSVRIGVFEEGGGVNVPACPSCSSLIRMFNPIVKASRNFIRGMTDLGYGFLFDKGEGMKNFKNNITEAVVESGVCNVLEIIRDHFAGVARVAREMNYSTIGDAYEFIALSIDPDNIEALRKTAEEGGAVQRLEADVDPETIAKKTESLIEEADETLENLKKAEKDLIEGPDFEKGSDPEEPE